MKLRGLELMRGIAALSVAVAHSDSSIGNNPALQLGRWHKFEMPGSAGVEFFFVLSGFVMALMHAHQIGPGGRPLAFLWRRACRIYPIYLFVLGIQLWQFWGAPLLSPGNVFAWASLLPIRTDSLIVVAWTLRQEIVFYGLFALCLLPFLGPLVLALWVGGSIAWLLLGYAFFLPGVAGVVVIHVFSPFNFEFFAGLLAGALFRRLPPHSGLAAALMGAGFAVVAARMSLDGWGRDYGPPVARLTYGLGYAGLLLGLAMLERSGAVRFRGWFGWLAEAAGVVSYPLYLFHLLVIDFIAKALAAHGWAVRIGADACFVVFVTGSVLASIPLAYGVDRPVQAALRSLTIRFSASSKSLPAARV